MLKNLTLLILSLLAFVSCQQTKYIEKVEYIHVRDSIVRVDTVERFVHVTDYQKIDSAIRLFDSITAMYNSLLLTDAEKDARLLTYAKQMFIYRTYCSDTLTACTDLACAYAAIYNSELQLWLEQQPFDTTLLLEQLNIHVTDKEITNTSQQTTIVKTKPFYQDTWFWLFICMIGIAIIYILFRFIVKYVQTL